MKPELNSKLKERFFAQYMNSALFQIQYINVNRMSKPKILTPLGYDSSFNVHNPSHSWLLLRPLSSISDDEAIEVAKIMGVSQSDFWTDQFAKYRVYTGKVQDKFLDYYTSYANSGKGYVNHFFRTGKWAEGNVWYCEEKLIVHVADYLRSKSFAIPFTGYSVEELIAAGWIRLESNETEI